MEPTEAVEPNNVKVNIQALDTTINLEIFDLPGDERFMILNNMYLRDTNIALIVFDLASKESLD